MFLSLSNFITHHFVTHVNVFWQRSILYVPVSFSVELGLAHVSCCSPRLLRRDNCSPAVFGITSNTVLVGETSG